MVEGLVIPSRASREVRVSGGARLESRVSRGAFFTLAVVLIVVLGEMASPARLRRVSVSGFGINAVRRRLRRVSR